MHPGLQQDWQMNIDYGGQAIQITSLTTEPTHIVLLDSNRREKLK